MFDSHNLDGLRYFFWLIPFYRFWSSSFYTTKATRTRTNVSKNHKSCGSFTPTFSHIRAVAALANGVELVFVYKSTTLFVSRSDVKFYATPVWFAFTFTFRWGDGEVNHTVDEVLNREYKGSGY